MRKILCTGAVSAEPLLIGASVGETVDVPDELAKQAVELGRAEYADEPAEKATKTDATPPATKKK